MVISEKIIQIMSKILTFRTLKICKMRTVFKYPIERCMKTFIALALYSQVGWTM
jgi:hypothetical protein